MIKSGFHLLVMMMLPSMTPAALAATQPNKPPEKRSAYERCVDSAGGATYRLLDCIGVEIGRVDDILNETYRSVRKKLSPERRRQLLILQRRWIISRDRICNKEARETGGSLGGIIGNLCIVGETESRIEWLRKFR